MIKRYPIDPPNTEHNQWPEVPRWPSPKDCEHRWELRKLTCSNGAIQYKNQCTLCGHGGTAIAYSKLTPEQMNQAPDFDPDLKSPEVERYHKERETYAMAREQVIESLRAEWQEWYDGYTNSEIWRERREAVLARDQWLCQSCRIQRARIAHHLTYERVGQEPLWHLVAVCDGCHHDLHARG